MLRITFNNVKLDSAQKKLYPEEDYPTLAKNLQRFFENVFSNEMVCSNAEDAKLAQQLISKLTVAIVPDQVGKPAGF
jgi:hypothetical protein